jgi:hypothetical protein
MANSASDSSPSQQSKTDARSHKGGGAGAPDPDRPPRPSRVPGVGPSTGVGASKTGQNPGLVPGATRPGFTEDQTKDIELNNGPLVENGAQVGAIDQRQRLDEDPDHSLRGEDQLVDGGTSELAPTVQEPRGEPEAGRSFEEGTPDATAKGPEGDEEE